MFTLVMSLALAQTPAYICDPDAKRDGWPMIGAERWSVALLGQEQSERLGVYVVPVCEHEGTYRFCRADGDMSPATAGDVAMEAESGHAIVRGALLDDGKSIDAPTWVEHDAAAALMACRLEWRLGDFKTLEEERVDSDGKEVWRFKVELELEAADVAAAVNEFLQKDRLDANHLICIDNRIELCTGR